MRRSSRIWNRAALVVLSALFTILAHTSSSEALWKKTTLTGQTYYSQRLMFLYLTGSHTKAYLLSKRLLKEGLLPEDAPIVGLIGKLSEKPLGIQAYIQEGLPPYMLPFTARLALKAGKMELAASMLKDTVSYLKKEEPLVVEAILKLYPYMDGLILKTALWQIKDSRYRDAIALLDEAARLFLPPNGALAELLKVWAQLELNQKEGLERSLEHTIDTADRLIARYQKIVAEDSPEAELFSHREDVALFSRLIAELDRLSRAYRASLTKATILHHTIEERLQARTEVAEEITLSYHRAMALVDGLLTTLSVRYHAATSAHLYASSEIATQWQKVLNRRLTHVEKDFLYLSLLDGAHAMDYLKNVSYCQLLYYMALDDDRRLLGKEGRILHILMKDLYSRADNTPLATTERVNALKGMLARAEGSDKRALSRLHRIKGSIEEALRGIDKTLSELKARQRRLYATYAPEELNRLYTLKAIAEELKEGKPKDPEGLLQAIEAVLPPL